MTIGGGGGGFGGNPRGNVRKGMFRQVAMQTTIYGGRRTVKYQCITHGGQRMTFSEQEWNNLPN